MNEISRTNKWTIKKYALHFSIFTNTNALVPEKIKLKLKLNRRVHWAIVPGDSYKILKDVYHQSRYVGGGKYKTLTHADHALQIPCYTYIRGQKCHCRVSDKKVTFTSNNEYVFSKDDHGVKISFRNSPKDDYHFTANDILCNDPLGRIIACLNINRNIRLETEAKEKAFKAESEGVYVCVADSLRAGNCLAGTISFAQQHKLDPNKHYSASELLSITANDYGRVRLAITAAIIRHQKEIKQGFAVLADHFFNIKFAHSIDRINQ